MLRKLALLALTIGLPGTAAAWDWGTAPAGDVSVYAIPKVTHDPDFGPESKAIGDGAGLRSTFRVHQWLHVLFDVSTQHIDEITGSGPGFTTTSENSTLLRVGPGYVLPSGSGVFAEYVSERGEGASYSGFGGRGRLNSNLFQNVDGFFELDYSSVDVDGENKTELGAALGGVFAIANNWGILAEFRHSKSTLLDLDTINQEFRVGVHASLDY